MAPADGWDEGFRYGVETFDVGVSAMADLHGDDRAAGVRDAGRAAQRGVGRAGGVPARGDRVRARAARRPLRRGPGVAARGDARRSSIPRARPRAATRSSSCRAQSYGFPERKEAQADRQLERAAAGRPGFDLDVILDRLVKAPEDIEAANEHMIRGTFHGGNRTYPQSGALRPAPGWASHRMPIEGLYQTGGTTHPGGSITGAPGPQRGDRAAAGPRTRPRGGGARCRTRACSRRLSHWAPRFVQAGMDYSDFVRVGDGVERWEDWLDAFAALGDRHAERAERGRDADAARHRRRGVAARRRRLPLRASSSGCVDARRAPRGRRPRGGGDLRRAPPPRPDGRADRGAARRRPRRRQPAPAVRTPNARRSSC